MRVARRKYGRRGPNTKGRKPNIGGRKPNIDNIDISWIQLIRGGRLLNYRAFILPPDV